MINESLKSNVSEENKEQLCNGSARRLRMQNTHHIVVEIWIDMGVGWVVVKKNSINRQWIDFIIS